METVTVKGKVYQIGEPYLVDGELCYLSGTVGDSLEFCSDKELTHLHSSAPASYVSAIQSIGTITDAPIELEDGEWYKVENNCEYITMVFWKDGMWRECEESAESIYSVDRFKPVCKMVRERT